MKTRLFFFFTLLFLSLNAFSQERKLSDEETSRYEKLMKEGEDLFGKEDFAGAKTKFTEAVKINPYASLPKEKLLAIDRKIQNQQNEQKVNLLIKDGNALFANRKFAEAKVKFNEVLIIQPGNQYASDKIAETEAILLAEKLKEEKRQEIANRIDVLIKEGDAFFSKRELAQAKERYIQVLALSYENTYAQSRIAEIDALLQQQMKNK